MKELTESAKCAKEIRKELKTAFPTVKFRIRSDNFSMGNSVNISWNLGSRTEEVNKVVNKYQYGHFDGMIDLYEQSNMRDDIPQAKFVQTQREYKTEEEIQNSKLKWNDPNHKDLWKEEKTLYHIIGRDLCNKMTISYGGLDTFLLSEYSHMVSGFCSPCLKDLVYQLLSKVDLMEGYHGIKHEQTETGENITNSFVIY